MTQPFLDSLHIRTMEISDLPLLASWATEAFSNIMHWTNESMLQHLQHDFQPEHSFVIVDGSELIGGIMAYPCSYDRGNELFLHTIVIQKDKQGTGIGKQFMEWFVSHAKKHGFTGIRLDAHRGLSSFAWYEKLGFQSTGWEQKLLELNA